jgi:27-O-demethylrifamycin SV methyltransferase
VGGAVGGASAARRWYPGGMSTALTAAHYDAVTAAWRLIMGESFHYGVFQPGDDPVAGLDAATERLSAHMADAAAPWSAADRVLDVGCGIGGPARWLAARTGARVTGLTNSPEGARTGALLTHALPVDFVVGDAQANGLPAGAFSVAWVLESSHLMPDKAALVRECARVLAPGGRFVLCDLIWHQPPALAEVLARRKDFGALDRAFGRARMETVEIYRDFCAAAGLHDVQVHDLTPQTRPTLLAWGANAQHHAEALRPLLGEAGLADFVRACEVLLDLWDTGRMGYCLVSARR